EKTSGHLRRIERQVDLANQVITALSDFAKLPVPDLQAVPVSECFEQALEAESLPPEVKVSVSCPPTIPKVLVDAKQVRIALGNLIRNARDAMPAGGTLSLSATAADGFVELAVADSGVGIPAETLRHI